MNKTELTKQLAETLDITHCESIRYFNAFQDVVTSELERQGTIVIQGFGTFTPWQQSERPGRNPQDGTPCMIRRRLSVKFKPGKFLLEAMNGQNYE